MKFRKFISELNRRNVFKAIIAYLAVAWIIIQIASIIFPVFNAPEYSLKVLIFILSIGLILWIGFSWVYDLTSEGFKKTSEIINSEEVSVLNNRRLNKFIVGALSVAVLLLLCLSFWAGSKWNEVSLIPPTKKVAVIPLLQDTTEEEGHFKFGMTDALITELSKVDQLSVISQASTQFLSTPAGMATMFILDETKSIDYFVSGTIDRKLNTIITHLKLQEKLNGEIIWEKTFSDDITSVNSMWANAAADLTRQMGIIVKEENTKLWTNLRPVNPEIHELYLKGKFYLSKNDFQTGLFYLQEAIDKNPGDSYAWSGLAEGYVSLGHGASPSPDVFPKAKVAALRAIELDSTNAQGWAALAHYHTYFGWDWELAEHAFKKANDLNPSLAYNHYHRAWYLAVFGRMNEAIEEHKLAKELDPFTPLHTAWLGELYLMVGLYEKGLVEAEKANQLVQNNPFSLIVKGRILVRQGKTEEGLEALEQLSILYPNWKHFMYGPALIKSGYHEQGQELIKELEDLPTTAYSALSLGIMYYELGDYSKAIDWLRFERKHAFYPWIRVQFMDPDIIKNQEYLELIRKMNLPDPAPLIYNAN